jgi:hypothetical protein
MNTTLKNILLITTAAVATLAMTAQAKVSSTSELRGYNACVEAADPELKGLHLTRVYYLNQEADKNVYYLNGSAWQSGERVAVRISCDTTNNGHRLLSQTNNEGRYTIEHTNVQIQVATQ